MRQKQLVKEIVLGMKSSGFAVSGVSRANTLYPLYTSPWTSFEELQNRLRSKDAEDATPQLDFDQEPGFSSVAVPSAWEIEGY